MNAKRQFARGSLPAHRHRYATDRLFKRHTLFRAGFLTWLATAALCAGTPALTYGTYFGGTGDQSATAIATDSAGNVIIVGTTTSASLPGTTNAFQSTHATGFPNNTDVFIAKFDSSGEHLQWTTFLGGDSDDFPTAVALDPGGNIYIAGSTQSSNFPAGTTVSCVPPSGFFYAVAFQSGCSTQPTTNATGHFLSEISADGRSLLYSVGFGQGQGPTAVTVNSRGEAYVATVGSTEGIFLFHFNATGNGISYGVFLGGGDIGFNARVSSLAVDSNGDCYLAGAATINIPTTANALQGSNSNANLTPDLGNGFILEVNPSGLQLLYGTWFGTKYSATSITSIALNPDGSVYFSGITTSTAFSATSGAYQSTPAPGYIAKLTPGRASLDWFSYLPEVPLPLDFAEDSANGGLTHVAVAPQSQLVYVAFGPDPALPGYTQSSGVIELTSGFAHVSSFITSDVGLTAFALGTGSIWFAGSCSWGFPSCYSSLPLISSNAFQWQQVGSSDAVLLGLTNISPSISIVGSAANGSAPYAAGQLISIYGSQLGPAAGVSAQIGTNLVVGSFVDGTNVLFDGVAAPILFARSDIVNTAIPCEVAGQASTQLVVEYLGVKSAPMTIPLSPAAPAIFTADSSGKGQALVFNQDYSLNSPNNPAPRGSAVSFYATGIGVMSPPCVDGEIYQNNFPTATLPVVVGVGNVGAQVLYSGQAPDLMAGVAQINIVIPNVVQPGILSLTLLVSGGFSAPGVTISVK
jgi:uncharacterized protein (TIGR03437 family)